MTSGDDVDQTGGDRALRGKITILGWARAGEEGSPGIAHGSRVRPSLVVPDGVDG
jgi:hypothetical protein